MEPRELSADQVGFVRFAVEPTSASSAFDLASHGRAREALDLALDRRLQSLQERARAAGLDLVHTERGMAIVALSGPTEKRSAVSPAAQHDQTQELVRSLQGELTELGQQAAQLQSDLAHRARDLSREVAGSAIADLVKAAKAQFKEYRPVVAWLRSLNADILDNLDLIRAAEQGDQAQRDALEHRYAINLFASLAEVLAVLSELSRIPLRQDVAVSGSVNQMGTVQAVGGVSHKIEGFFRACMQAGRLTGTQGVLLPESNSDNVVLMPDVSEAVAAFHVWTARSVEEAIELMTGKPAGAEASGSDYLEGTIFRAVASQLDEFNHILMQPGLGRQLLDA